jgi:hypothetical protein
MPSGLGGSVPRPLLRFPSAFPSRSWSSRWVRACPWRARHWPRNTWAPAARNWFGIFAPPQTPEPIVDKIYQSLNRALSQPDIVSTLTRDGFEPKALSPEKFALRFHGEMNYWQKFVQDNPLKVD